MYRNGRLIPSLAFLGAAALFLAAYLDGRQITQHTGRVLKALSVGQIGMITFGVLLFVYGAIGYISIWLEGRELRPGKRKSSPRAGVFVACLILSAVLVALAGSFVRLIYYELTEGIAASALEGAIAGTIFLGGPSCSCSIENTSSRMK
jgi:hypothetical protein